MYLPANPTNQKQVATEAGVSQSTVSLVLSGRGLIAEETRKRVLDVANRLRYRPNLLVHGIQTGKTRTIGVMAPPFDSYWSQILYGLHDVLSEADNVPIMLWAPHDIRRRYTRKRFEANELDQIHRLVDRRVDGVIFGRRLRRCMPNTYTFFGLAICRSSRSIMKWMRSSVQRSSEVTRPTADA